MTIREGDVDMTIREGDVDKGGKRSWQWRERETYIYTMLYSDILRYT